MKTNITLKIEAELVSEARVVVAREGTSISALLASRLEQIVGEANAYERAQRRALARIKAALPWVGSGRTLATNFTKDKSS